MKRRKFVALFGIALAWPVAMQAQQAGGSLELASCASVRRPRHGLRRFGKGCASMD